MSTAPQAPASVTANARWRANLQAYFERLEQAPAVAVEGKLSRMVGLTLEAVGCQAAIGDRCRIYNPGGADVDAEVVGFSGERLFLMPTGIPRGLSPNARVIPLGGAGDVAVGEALLDGCSMAPDGLWIVAGRCTSASGGRYMAR